MTRETKRTVKHVIWGAVLGAIIAMVVGFAWGGWVTGKTSMEQSDAAVVATQAAICVAQFMVAPDHEAKVAEFAALSSWNQDDFVRKGGWDKMPGEEVANYAVARPCAKGIELLTQK
jgi:hypothetical protein